MRSVLSLPPALQAVWTAVYSQILTAHSTSQVPGMIGELSRERAEHEAWEAVRRADGGVMPEEQEREEEKRTVAVTRPADEPTDEEMIVALAPIAAKACQVLNASPGAQQRVVEACGASWKAARAWGRK